MAALSDKLPVYFTKMIRTQSLLRQAAFRRLAPILPVLECMIPLSVFPPVLEYA